MAIIDRFEAYLNVSGQRAKEFDSVGTDRNTAEITSIPQVSKCIEAKSGAGSEVVFVIKPGYKFDCDFLQWTIAIDGTEVSFPIVRRVEYSPHTGNHYKTDGIVIKDQNGLWVDHKYHFHDLAIDSHASKDKIKTFKEKKLQLGIISVTVIRYINAVETRPEKSKVTLTEELGLIPEEVFKGQTVSYAASFKAAANCSPPSVYHGEVDGPPVAQFEFHYRSQDALKTMGLIPRTPSPLPLEERDIYSLNEIEMRCLIRKLKAQSEKVKQEVETTLAIKREREDAGSPTGPSRGRKGRRTSTVVPIIELD